VLLRAYPDAKSNAVAVEARLLSEHLPEDRQRETDSGGTALQLLYYQDSSTHSVQEAARKVWKTLTTPAPKRCVSSVNFGGAPRVVKKAKVVGEGEVEAVQPFRRKTVSVVSGVHDMFFLSSLWIERLLDVFLRSSSHAGEKSPRSSVLNQASLEKKSGGGILVTPAAPPSASKLNKLSPQDATERLISSVGARGAEEGGVDGSAVSPVSGPVPIPSFRSSRISSRQSSTSSFAKLRALRDDDSSADEEGEGVPPMHSAQKVEWTEDVWYFYSSGNLCPVMLRCFAAGRLSSGSDLCAVLVQRPLRRPRAESAQADNPASLFPPRILRHRCCRRRCRPFGEPEE